MDGTGFVIGCGLISMGIYYGLDKIAEAVRFKRTDINFKDSIRVNMVHGTAEDFGVGDCDVHENSTRTCERGTKGCVRKHIPIIPQPRGGR